MNTVESSVIHISYSSAAIYVHTAIQFGLADHTLTYFTRFAPNIVINASLADHTRAPLPIVHFLRFS